MNLVINYREEDLDQVLTEKFPYYRMVLIVIWETIGGETFKTLFAHLAIKGGVVLIGTITSYKETGFTGLPIGDLNTQLRRGSKSINGFTLLNYKEYVQEYLPQLIEGIQEGKIKVQIDLGEKSEGGQFFGIDQVQRGEEWLHQGEEFG